MYERQQADRRRCSSAASSSAAPSCQKPHAAGLTSETFDYLGVPRTYELYVPSGYDGTRPVPVVFEFHGFGSNAAEQIVYGDFRPLADQNDFLIVAPDGQQSAGGRHFNLTGEPGLQNDVQMVGALLDLIESQFCVDTQRVYSTGDVRRGCDDLRTACTDSDRFAAFAPVAVVLFPQNICTNVRPIAIMGFSGTADPIVPFGGGAVHCCGGAVLAAPSDAMANWAMHNSCAPDFTEAPVGTDVRQRTWNGCLDDSAVIFNIVDGGGHTWPGSAIQVASLGKTTDQINASSAIWAFFQQHPLPPAPPPSPSSSH